MRILITGAAGFVGRHLVDYLAHARPTGELYGTSLTHISADSRISYHQIDLKDRQAVQDLLTQVKPDRIFHLAAQSSPRQSFDDPWETLENNIRIQLNLIQACLETSQKPSMLVVSSAEIYRDSDTLIGEDHPFGPTSPYGVSKIAQDMLALQYFQTHHLPILRTRPFNHIGPGQDERFVIADFAMQIAQIEAGHKPPIIAVGNLAARRDFSDVRDVVRAYDLVMEHGRPGEVYNVASGTAHSIQEMLDHLLSLTATRIEVRIDPERFRPVDPAVKRGDTGRLRQATGWEPQISVQQTLLDILNECRQHVQVR